MAYDLVECRLGEIMTFTQGKQISVDKQFTSPEDGHKRFLRIVDYTKENEPQRFVSNPGEKYIVNKDDLVMIRYGSQTAGKVVRGHEGVIANNVFKMSFDKNKIDKDFAFYLLSNETVYRDLNNSQSSSTMPAINFGMLKNYKVKIPPLRIQRKIGYTLKTIDEKLLVNKETISNLEQLTQTLFKRWFIDFEFPNEDGEPYKSSGGKMLESELGFIPNHWGTATLNSICEANKYSILSSNQWNFVNYLDTGNITENNIEDIQKLYFGKDKVPSRAKRIVKENDIIYSTVRPNQNHYGIIKDPMENMVVSTGFAVLTSTTNYSTEFIYLWLTQKEISQKLQSMAEQSTSAYPSIKPIDILSMKLMIPSEKELINFSNIIRSQFDLMWKLQQQNQMLGQIRDTLLPKLLSGEIELPDEIEVTEHVPIS